ncbi:transposase [Bradyrhizobium sp. 169]|uniref:transposase n=1 Tax=Bradyrhizobium sp. 169 TaxID=2782640 RepID=UPI001FF7D791|nr:transposase [Bradyrhizobium sp. 169]MCK1590335.1 transposase [Bradyrhizobium sp. 169]
MTLFLEAQGPPRKQIILDIEATNDPLDSYQEGRFFHGYHCRCCYLSFYVFCGICC